MKLLEQTAGFRFQDSSFSPQPSDLRPQTSALAQWNEWRTTKGAALCQQLRQKAAAMGFADDSFDDFYKLMSLSHQTSDVQRSMFNVQRSSALTSAIVSSLTDNFNYIGWA
jgi:hypothetical protein